MIKQIEPHRTGLLVTDTQDLINGIVMKLNESIAVQNEIIEYLNKQEEAGEKSDD